MDRRSKVGAKSGGAGNISPVSGGGSQSTSKRAAGGAGNGGPVPAPTTQAKVMESLHRHYVMGREVCEAAGTVRMHCVGDILALSALLLELSTDAHHRPDIVFSALLMSALANDDSNEAFSLVRTQQCGVEMEWQSRGSPRILRRVILREHPAAGPSSSVFPRSPTAAFAAPAFSHSHSGGGSVIAASLGSPPRVPASSPTTAQAPTMGGGNSSNGKSGGGSASAALMMLPAASPTTQAASLPALTEADLDDRRNRVDVCFHCVGLSTPAAASYCKLVPLAIQRPGMRVNTLWAILHFAAAAGNLAVLRQMIQEMRTKAVFVAMVGRLAGQCRGFCLTHAAALHGEIPALAVLTNQGGLSLFQGDEYGWTCAHNAAQAGQVDTLRFLSAVNSSRTLSLRTATGWSVAHVAAASNQYYVLMWLIEEKRLDIASDTDVRGATPLHYLAQLAFVDTLRWICQYAVSCVTELDAAHSGDNREVGLSVIQQKVLSNARALLGAVANARDATGMSPEELMMLHPECQEGGRYAEDAALVLQWLVGYHQLAATEEEEELVTVAPENVPLLVPNEAS